MPSATKSSVSAIESIFEAIGQINRLSSTMAPAVEEQGAATAEISRNVGEAAVGAQEVSTKMTGVTQAAQDMGQVSSHVLDVAKSLNEQAEALRAELDGFLHDIRDAA